MKNPYEEKFVEDEVLLGRRSLWTGLIVFVLIVGLPGLSLFRPEALPPGTGGILRRIEEGVKHLPVFDCWRHRDQTLLSKGPGLGNRRVFAGENGWLYYRADLDAVHGKGPQYEEPPSVERAGVDQPWVAPLPVIKAFNEELKSRGIGLILVPVPTKPMVCREGLGLAHGEAAPRAFSETVDELSAAGVEVVDLFPVFESIEREENRFLRQDTHWTPTAMEASARFVAARISPGVSQIKIQTEYAERENEGDLVGMLDLIDAGTIYPEERVKLHRIIDAAKGTPLASDPSSEIVVLGDSFVNIFEDPALGFALEEETSIGAGFSSHLAAAIGRPVQTIAINGGGATAVREAFVKLPVKEIAAKKTIVWVLSARDVLLPEIPARRAGIEWRSVSFLSADVPAVEKGETSMELNGVLREKSFVEDPAQTPYANAIYATIFEGPEGEEICVYFWAFRDRKLSPESRLEIGERYHLRLLPLGDDAEANRATRLDDFFRPDLSPWFAEEVREPGK